MFMYEEDVLRTHSLELYKEQVFRCFA